jgi:hypothetical protein
MLYQPLKGIAGILGKPAPCTTKPKTISPGIHVTGQSLTANAGQVVGQYDLQIANGSFLKIITAGIPVQICATIITHANDVTNFMQHRVDWRVIANKNTLANDARFRFAPVATRDCLSVADAFRKEAKPLQEPIDIIASDIADSQDRLILVAGAQMPES